MKRWESCPHNSFIALLSPGFSTLETVSPSGLIYSAPLASLADIRKTPQFEDPPSSSLGRTVLAEVQDETPADAMYLQMDQAGGLPPIPPRTIPEPTPEHDALLAAYSFPCDASSPSFPVSPSIEGRPRNADSRLPYPLVPATHKQQFWEVPLLKDQIVTPQSRGKQGKPSRVTAPRIDDQLTKTGEYYTRCRSEDLRLPHDRKLLTRKTWTQWEHTAALKALRWYRGWNRTFNIRKSSEDEQHVALPTI
ncbi:hypothetical protein FS837_010607 [Tulasnella sp. UAMH 9824]|nr:hypothetical protein FS837_010607 [Tulasnella sp. UAMH 9824]